MGYIAFRTREKIINAQHVSVASTRSHKWLPRNPAPPVINTLFSVFRLIAFRPYPPPMDSSSIVAHFPGYMMCISGYLLRFRGTLLHPAAERGSQEHEPIERAPTALDQADAGDL
jgi:hypothetical protein